MAADTIVVYKKRTTLRIKNYMLSSKFALSLFLWLFGYIWLYGSIYIYIYIYLYIYNNNNNNNLIKKERNRKN